MSPEDDHLQGEVNSNSNNGLNTDEHWPTGNHVSPKGYINSNAILKPNSGDSHTWLPLLGHHNTSDIPTTNNNKWPVLTSPSNLTNSKYVWRELPQDDDSLGLYKPNLNTANALSNANGLNGKSEHESLTGVVRHPKNDYPNDDYYERSDCGIGFCKPKWARVFASTHVFMVIFLLAWILQGMYFTYFVSVITTIEKLFQIKSKTTGLLMSATEFGQICTSLFLTYFAGRGHRPRWIACGMIVFAMATFGCTLPHFIFGNDLLHSTNTFYGGNINNAVTISTSPSQNSSDSDAYISDIHLPSHANLCHQNSNYSNVCEEKTLLEQEAHSQIRNVILGIFFMSLLFVGIGQTAVSTLGIPYIDDNVASKESAVYIAITIGVRILGPAAGFILGSFCTRLYVDLSDPGFGPSDPKWVGAWYLGLVMISSLMIITSLAMLAFPKQLRGNRIPAPHQVDSIDVHKTINKIEQPEEESKPQLKDFPKTIKRHLKNDILMFRTASSVLHLLPIAGLYTFLPKYLESQFHLPAHDANLITGLGGILVMGIGIVVSGFVLLKFSPTARSVAAWIAFTALMYSLGMAMLMFIGCSLDNFVGGIDVKTDQFSQIESNLTTVSYDLTCNQNCKCDSNKFSPICGIDGRTYYSSCYAGCRSSLIEGGKTHFFDCDCIEKPESVSDKVEAVSGFCDVNCQNFTYFIILFSFLVFIHSTSEVGSMLLVMRCTDPKDKAMAMGIIQFATSLFGNVPCPIIYGAVIDSTCLIWETICDKQGACSLYNPDSFRHFFLGTTSGIMFLAFIMDVVVWHKANRIDIDPESKDKEDDYSKEKPTITPESSV
ncbi:solute carrier organic anion transporter family member 74D isoform X2 [Contarinia nasturtii]|uniref:solute carrier organic anion transporter family member 74D isoform X2 n=1 Tax=Contarinia nasturtii TaxID=265458 RepID=UPI0012D402CE|nr:solute carrier organic anion transporter family member 74D isoform X2 [Contarinia nasturtii]